MSESASEPLSLTAAQPASDGRLALARKWRPRDFESLIGQDLVVRALRHALDTGRIHHAYLLSGTRGVGKTTIARVIAKAVNCEQGPTSRPCGRCVSCVGVDAGRFPDYVEMDAASNRRVEEMSVLLENASYAPAIGRYKVFVIDEVHMLTNHAFNAMLKTLEEPPGHVIFVLATTDPQKVPVTVLSRCLHFGLRNVSPENIAAHLGRVLQAEGVAHDAGSLSLLGQAAGGSVRDALSLLDQAIALGGGEVREAEVRAMLGTVDEGLVGELVQLLVAGDGRGLVAFTDRCREANVAFGPLLLEFAAQLQRAALLQLIAGTEPGSTSKQSDNGTTGQDARAAHMARGVSPADLQVWYQIATHGARDLPLAPEPSVGFLMSTIRMLAFVPDTMAAVAVDPAANGKGALRARSVATPAQSAAQSAAQSTAQPAVQPAAQSTAGPAPADDAGGSRNDRVSLGGPDDWARLAAEIKVAGMARQFMNQSEFLGVDGAVIRLRVPIEQLADPAWVGRVQEAVSAHTGRKWRLEVSVGQLAGETVASRQAQDRARRMSDANASIESDSFVQDLKKSFGATIVPNSIESTDGEQQP